MTVTRTTRTVRVVRNADKTVISEITTVSEGELTDAEADAWDEELRRLGDAVVEGMDAVRKQVWNIFRRVR